jgi:hypothetical protein
LRLEHEPAILTRHEYEITYIGMPSSLAEDAARRHAPEMFRRHLNAKLAARKVVGTILRV